MDPQTLQDYGPFVAAIIGMHGLAEALRMIIGKRQSQNGSGKSSCKHFPSFTPEDRLAMNSAKEAIARIERDVTKTHEQLVKTGTQQVVLLERLLDVVKKNGGT